MRQQQHFSSQYSQGLRKKEEERERGHGEEVRALAEGGGALKAQMRTLCFPGGVLFFEVNSSSPALSVSPHATV